jgi:zinc carboxypeptidase
MRKPFLAAIAAAIFALVVTGPASAAETVRFLPTVKRTVKTKSTTSSWCDSPLAGAGVVRKRWRAPMTGFMSARLKGRRGTNWDLAAFDAAGNRRAASLGFGRRELVQTWVESGELMTLQACRRSGERRRGALRISFADVQPPKPEGIPQLVSVAYDSNADLERLEATGVDLTHNIHDGNADVIVANANQRNMLVEQGFDVQTKVADLRSQFFRARTQEMAYAADVGVDGSPLPSGRTTYRVYSDYQKDLETLAEQYPDIVKPMALPENSFQGRPLSGVEISKNVNAADEDGRPVFLLVGEHHAREWPSSEAAMEFAIMLAQGYGNDDRITRLLERTRIVVVPIINPDGFISSRSWPADPADILGGGGRGFPVDPDQDNPGLGIDPDANNPCGGRPDLGLPEDVCESIRTCAVNGENPDGSCEVVLDLYLAEGIAPPGGIFSYRRKNCDGAIPEPLVPCELQHGVDPNRNYGEKWGGPGSGDDRTSQSYRGSGQWSEPETQAVHEYSQNRQITALITLHNVAALVLRPPGLHFDGKAPDEERLKEIGDAMGRATGYTSQYGFQLYDTAGTTEDWNYAAAGTYGFTIEIGPENGDFHMPYKTGFIDQWTGDYEPAEDGKGLREALMIAAEAAANPADHSVVKGTAPAGSVLRVRKDFKTFTYDAFCKERAPGFGVLVATSTQGCVDEQDEATFTPDFLESTLVVPPSGKFEWHMNPSTRPFVGADRDVLGEETTEVYHQEVSHDGPDGQSLPVGSHTETVKFSITDADATDLMVDLTFPDASEDYDLELCKVDAEGECQPFGTGTSEGSSGKSTGEPEHIETVKAEPGSLVGDYEATVYNYLATADEWNMTISALERPIIVVPGTREAWTLTCTTPTGQEASRDLFIDRGQRLTVNFDGACETRAKKPSKR